MSSGKKGNGQRGGQSLWPSVQSLSLEFPETHTFTLTTSYTFTHIHTDTLIHTHSH